jgi:lysophospholipase L1-like esterase
MHTLMDTRPPPFPRACMRAATPHTSPTDADAMGAGSPGASLLLVLLLAATTACLTPGSSAKLGGLHEGASDSPATPARLGARTLAQQQHGGARADGGDAADPQVPTNAAPQEWRTYYEHLCSLAVAGQPLCGLLGPLLQWKYSLTPTQLRRAAAHVGPNQRLRRVVRDLITGHAPVNVGVIGTSVSYGTGASERGSTDWFSVLGSALRAAFPKANVTMHNGCFPGTPSAFANMCVNMMVKPDVDLLLIEYVTNDFMIDSMTSNVRMMAYERLLRKVLQKQRHPAVLLLQHLTWGQGFPEGHELQGQRVGQKMYHESAEDQYGSMAQYYSLPWLSYRNAVWVDAAHPTGRASFPTGWSSLSDDYVHPNDAGHRVLADIVMWLVHSTAVDLLWQPFSKADAWHIHVPLPPPMHRGNWEEKTETCMLDDELRTIVDEGQSAGWAFVNEGTAGSRKTGYVTTTPGTRLVLVLDTRKLLGDGVVFAGADASPEHDRAISLMLSYLKSYSGHGIASVTCGPGCECKPSSIDGHHAQRTSTTFMKLVHVVAVESSCRVSLAVGQATNSTGHKFKLTAVMTHRAKELSFAWPDEPAMFVAADVFSGAFGQPEYFLESNKESPVR